ncbi:MAG: glycerol-3-phosphate dehydrogenase/oxidase [Myxococcaceae bacterium]|nr:MAG: glycerol-3-phosphate dehydrogenase/oxidase [Myxococcaceae bacterium]
MTTDLAHRRPDCDVLIIGGGVNGTGLARDLSLRGLRVILLERNDLAFGASGNSSGMIHGGPRYLTTHPSVTRSSCVDSGYIQTIAPHMIFRTPFVMPIYGHGPVARVRFDAFDAFFSLYDEYQPLKRGKPHTRLTPAETLTLVPGLRSDDLYGSVTFDEWGIYGNRLCVANAIDAVEHGCRLYVHTSVERIVVEEGRATGVTARDRIDGRAYEFSARAVVNCTGAWSPITAATAGVSEHVKVRPGKGVHLILDRPITDIGVMADAVDGRQIFIEPWGNTALIGTTDDDTYADLDDLPVTTDEVRYLVEGIEQVLPRVRDARIIGVTVGARPSLYAWGKMEDALSREHEVVDHAAHGAQGLFSLIGGKLASYRMFAQEAADLIAPKLGNHAPCTTHSAPLPGGDRPADIDLLAARFELSRFAVERLVTRHGSRAETILADSGRRGRMVVCSHEPVLACEVRWAAKHEYARTLLDVARRTNLAMGACGGNDCALAGAVIAGEELGWSPGEVRAQAAELLRSRQRSRLPAIGDKQARAEAMTMAALRTLGRAALP